MSSFLYAPICKIDNRKCEPLIRFLFLSQAYERRFPSCDMIPVFEGSDIISEERSEDGAEMIVVRRCKLNVDAPYLLKKVIEVQLIAQLSSTNWTSARVFAEESQIKGC